MNNGLRARLFALLWTSALIPFASASAAEDWRPQLEPLPSGRVRGPKTPFAIRIPSVVPSERLQRLTLELDAIDVTRLIDSSRAPIYVFTPAEALSYGVHQLRLVEYTAEGDIVERGTWTVEVRKSAAFREASLGMDGDLSLIRRISDNDTTGLPDRDTATGSLTIDARASEGDWRGTAYIPLIFSEAAEGRKGDVGDFLITSSEGPVLVQAGHHAIGSESLVVGGLTSRGISVTAAKADRSQNIMGFAMHASPISGARDGLGIGDTDDRVDGFVWTGYPVLSDDHYVQVSAAYVDGNGPGDGAGTWGDPTVVGGAAWGLSADAGWKHNRIRMRGEYAGSKFDFDGDGGFDPEKDSALSALFTYRPWDQKQVDGQPMDMTLGIERRKVGPFFATPASPSSATDKDTLRGFMNYSWAAFQVDATLLRERTNVDGNELLSTDQTNIASIAVGYAPLPSDDAERPYGAWGQQSYRFSLTRQKDETLELPVGSSGSGIDTSTHTLELGAQFEHERWRWGVAHSVIRANDLTHFNPDTRDANSELNATFDIGDHFSLSPRVQIGRLKYTQTGVVSRTRIVGMAVVYAPTERWQMHLGVDVNRNEVSDDSADTETKTASAGIAWIAIPARTHRPGVRLILDGSRTETTDRIDPGLSAESYQLFFRLILGWSELY